MAARSLRQRFASSAAPWYGVTVSSCGSPPISGSAREAGLDLRGDARRIPVPRLGEDENAGTLTGALLEIAIVGGDLDQELDLNGDRQDRLFGAPRVTREHDQQTGQSSQDARKEKRTSTLGRVHEGRFGRCRRRCKPRRRKVSAANRNIRLFSSESDFIADDRERRYPTSAHDVERRRTCQRVISPGRRDPHAAPRTPRILPAIVNGDGMSGYRRTIVRSPARFGCYAVARVARKVLMSSLSQPAISCALAAARVAVAPRACWRLPQHSGARADGLLGDRGGALEPCRRDERRDFAHQIGGRSRRGCAATCGAPPRSAGWRPERRAPARGLCPAPCTRARARRSRRPWP